MPATRTTVNLPMPAARFRSLVQGPDGNLYVAEMYKTKNCFACHRIDRNHLGPPLKNIGAKYADDKGVDVMLSKKIREGSVGVWGQVPMPPQPQVTETESLTLARWILQLK